MRLAENLERAAAIGRAHLTGGVVDALRLQTTGNGRGLETAISTVAERELFTEALLSAAHSHFEEIKTATAR